MFSRASGSNRGSVLAYSLVSICSGENPFFGYQVPGAVIELKQGLGRLIRSTLDYGLLAVLDNRITKKRYGKIFRDSLPAFPIVDQLSQVADFFRIQGGGSDG